MTIDLDRARLAQEQTLTWQLRDMKLTEMVTVYLSVDKGSHEHTIYCVLIPFREAEAVLSNPADWDLLFGEGTPSAVGTEPVIKYLRHGVDTGREPLVINRCFNESQTNYGQRTHYSEISEEFRLFHNLYHDRETDEYIKIDDEGNEERVAIVEPHCIKIRLKEIRQFLAIKRMYLSIQFRHYEYSEHSLEELGVSEDEVKLSGPNSDDIDICWSRWGYSADYNIRENYRTFSVLEGKRLIKPLPVSESGFRGFAEELKKKYVEFIIGVDENGDEINATCDPTKVNYYDRNPEFPHHLTAVQFRKAVLDKYYREPSKYSVEDSGLGCPWWGMRIDNHHDDKVVVFLRDLCSLPYTEQHHWRAYNIRPEGGISDTYFKRCIEGRFTDSDRPEHLFKQSYRDLQKESEKYLGWQLLLPLAPGDEHHFTSLRVPSTDEHREFDELVLSLTKLLIDSLNQKQLKELISIEQEENLNSEQKQQLNRSIGCLEIALSCCDVEDAADHISFLRELQKLRSSGTAHRKGSNYQKIAKDFGIESQSLQAVFAGVLWKALSVLDYFIWLVRSGQVNPEIIKKNSLEKGYAIFDEMIGFAKSDVTDGAINHDEVIHELESKP